MAAAMSRIAKPLPVSPKIYRHFASITIGLTFCVALFANGEAREDAQQRVVAAVDKANQIKHEASDMPARQFRVGNLDDNSGGSFGGDSGVVIAGGGGGSEVSGGDEFDLTSSRGTMVSGEYEVGAERPGESQTAQPTEVRSAADSTVSPATSAAKRRKPPPPTQAQINQILAASRARSGSGSTSSD